MLGPASTPPDGPSVHSTTAIVTLLALTGLMFPFEFRAARRVSPRSPRFSDETPS